MPSNIFIVVLDGYTFAKDQSWLRDYKMLMSLSQHFNNLRIADVNWALQTTFQMTTAPKEGTATSLEHPAASDITITNTPYFAKCPTRPIYPDPTYNHHLHIHLTRGAFLREIPHALRKFNSRRT